MLRAEALETMLYGCITWSPRACHKDTLRRAHQSFLARGISWRKNNRVDYPTSYLDTLMKTGSESTEATLRRRRIFFGGYVARMEDTGLPKCMMFGEPVGGADCVGRQEKGGWGVSWPKSFRHQRRPVDDCNPGRGEIAQDGRTRGGTLHGQIDRWLENQGRTTACRGMPERDGKDQGEDSLKQASPCWFGCHSWVATSGVNLYPPNVYVCFVLFSYFCFHRSRDPLFNRSSFFVLRYACAPQPHGFPLFCFVLNV